MGTRCANLDSGATLHPLQSKHMPAEEIEDLLYRRSGVQGLLGVSSDFRDLLVSQGPHARFALKTFCYRTLRHLGSLAAALGRLERHHSHCSCGENSTEVRKAICQDCSWLGLEIDDAANLRNGPWMSSSTSKVAAYVIAAGEHFMIARHAHGLLQYSFAKTSSSERNVHE